MSTCASMAPLLDLQVVLLNDFNELLLPMIFKATFFWTHNGTVIKLIASCYKRVYVFVANRRSEIQDQSSSLDSSQNWFKSTQISLE